MMQLLQFKNQFFSELSEMHPVTEIQSFFNLLICFLVKFSKILIPIKIKLLSNYQSPS